MANAAAGPRGALAYASHRAAEPITIDGQLDEPAWRQAPRTRRFVHVETGSVAFFDTRAALLWDNTNLYVGFWVEEHDVWSTGAERRGFVWPENTVEVFLAGPGGHYQLSVNPVGQTQELFFIWKDAYTRGGRYDVAEFGLAAHKPMVLGSDMRPRHPRGMRWLFDDWQFPGLSTAVRIDGELNQRNHIDGGWTVEIALPWEGLSRLIDPAPPGQGQGLQVALARNQVIDQRASRHTATWSWHQAGEAGLYAPEHYPQVRLVS
jgi:cellulose/xylan binding protein with CBM9 domain